MSEIADHDQAARRHPDFPADDPYDARIFVYFDRNGLVKIKIKPPRIRVMVRGRFARRRGIRARRVRRSSNRSRSNRSPPGGGDDISRPARRFRANWQGCISRELFRWRAFGSAQRQNSAWLIKGKSLARCIPVACRFTQPLAHLLQPFPPRKASQTPADIGTAGFPMPERRHSNA